MLVSFKAKRLFDQILIYFVRTKKTFIDVYSRHEGGEISIWANITLQTVAKSNNFFLLLFLLGIHSCAFIKNRDVNSGMFLSQRILSTQTMEWSPSSARSKKVWSIKSIISFTRKLAYRKKKAHCENEVVNKTFASRRLLLKQNNFRSTRKAIKESLCELSFIDSSLLSQRM